MPANETDKPPEKHLRSSPRSPFLKRFRPPNRPGNALKADARREIIKGLKTQKAGRKMTKFFETSVLRQTVGRYFALAEDFVEIGGIGA
jgi:hypothetical protein